MINLTNIESPSEHVTARSKAMWATKYDQGEFTLTYRVVPFGRKHDHQTKDRRLVLFDLRRGVAECLSLETGEACEANSFGRLCSHVLAAHRSMEKASKRFEERRAA